MSLVVPLDFLVVSKSPIDEIIGSLTLESLQAKLDYERKQVLRTQAGIACVRSQASKQYLLAFVVNDSK